MENILELRERLDSGFEWLAVRENGRTVPLRRDEIELESVNGSSRIGFTCDDGFRIWRVLEFIPEGVEFTLQLSRAGGRDHESFRFIPRETAAAFAANIEIARLRQANEIADVVKNGFPELRPLRISLSKGNSRLAKIVFGRRGGGQTGVLADVTGRMTHESLLASAFDWLERLQLYKKNRIDEVWIAAEGRRARDLQKLLAMLKASERSRIAVLELKIDPDENTAKLLPKRPLSDLWRTKAAKLAIPPELEISETARSIIAHAPDKIDVIVSRHGETLRFRGLPFARVRRLMGKENAWYGIGRDRKLLSDETRNDFHNLLEDLHRYRDPELEEKRHDLFRLRSEAWLESILKRNIKLLDPNLILSPIYNQFKTSADKIDLLALRRDGRLVVIEVKTAPDRETVFQAADYWRKIELQRRKGVLAAAKLFGDLQIADIPALVYIAAPALHFHSDLARFAKMLSPEIELWRWDLHEDWRKEIRVIRRLNYESR